ncbi:MAG: HAD-IIB family hydrolase [Proteobacteria bacterium]|nr:HAD-IIB family hydrolase [Pseudomonadota bacterium]MBU1687768.1 HAD-IIB family hydrolase [Pseudomonadota bacterium]
MNDKGLYLQLFSIHGLIRGTSPELGRDADTGGQIKYVLELARALAERDDVAQVDLVTRLIDDKTVAKEYSQVIEPLADKARLVRIACGGRRYIRKELLWPHLQEFVDNTIRFIRSENRVPDLFHGHYADGGLVAMELAAAFDAPFIFTGHSMGRNKLAKLLADGMNQIDIDKQYHMDTRIQVEEEIISHSDQIITSTQQEIDKQYGLYDNFKEGHFEVIPPGIDMRNFYPYYDSQLDTGLMSQEVKQTRLMLLAELHKFWLQPEKPFILVLCRPDHRKNITGLIEAYGNNKELQALANLAVFAGIRQNITTMEENEQAVLTDMLLQMDRFDLYGKMAIPKKHDFATEVPELYRLCAEAKGVFVNPALVEPFGLTLIEASACGLPIVATDDGGPVDIIRNCQNGILVNATDPMAIGRAIQTILVDSKLWDTYSNNGINGVLSYYSWQAHCQKTMDQLQKIFPEVVAAESRKEDSLPIAARSRPSFGKRLTSLDHLFITDIDNTLIGDDESLHQLLAILEENHDRMAWGVATGRSIGLTIDAMTEYNIPIPDTLICSVGTEIYYGPDLRQDKGWQQHISHRWQPERIKEVLGKVTFLTFQEAEGQRSHKISYYMADDYDYLAWIHHVLDEAKLQCEIIYSHGRFLDILPLRASKGKAIDYVIHKFGFPPRQVMVSGDSGNDEDMLLGQARGLVVGNYSEELEKLKGKPRVYFSKENYAAGIIDGLQHFGLV